jgi:hypothetical protein
MIDEMIEYWEEKLTSKNDMVWVDSLWLINKSKLFKPI